MAIDFNFPLDRKIALITGAGSGIGKGISESFAAKGVSVAVVDLSIGAETAVANKISNGATAFQCDVSKSDSVNATVKAVLEQYGKIDILVNSAGIVALAPAEEISQKDWDLTLNVNLTGTFLMAQAVGKVMLKAKSGKIINMASQAGTIALQDHVAYCASKFGVIGVTKVLASEWGRHGITVNSISPTVVLTELGKKAWDGPKGDALKALIPTGRFAEPEEIAAAAIFLASEGANMINGADLLVDGGYTIR